MGQGHTSSRAASAVLLRISASSQVSLFFVALLKDVWAPMDRFESKLHAWIPPSIPPSYETHVLLSSVLGIVVSCCNDSSPYRVSQDSSKFLLTESSDGLMLSAAMHRSRERSNSAAQGDANAVPLVRHRSYTSDEHGINAQRRQREIDRSTGGAGTRRLTWDSTQEAPPVPKPPVDWEHLDAFQVSACSSRLSAMYFTVLRTT